MFTLNKPTNNWYNFLIKHNNKRVLDVTDMVNTYSTECCWLINSNISNFGYNVNGWHFKNKEDAIAFMLVWGYDR